MLNSWRQHPEGTAITMTCFGKHDQHIPSATRADTTQSKAWADRKIGLYNTTSHGFLAHQPAKRMNPEVLWQQKYANLRQRKMGTIAIACVAHMSLDRASWHAQNIRSWFQVVDCDIETESQGGLSLKKEKERKNDPTEANF